MLLVAVHFSMLPPAEKKNALVPDGCGRKLQEIPLEMLTVFDIRLSAYSAMDL